MKTLITIFFSILLVLPCFAQQVLPLAFPDEITYRGDVAYFQGTPFTGKLIDNNTNKEMGEFREGYKNGFFTEYFANGKTKTKRLYKLGKENGLNTEWFSNGQKKSEYLFVSGIIVDGKYTTYLENGQKEKEESFLNGKKTLVALYKDGFLYEPSVEYFTRGGKKAEGFLKNGLKDGIWTEWYRTGEKKREERYDSGNHVSLIYENINFITDIDDNVYHSVTIGSQIWLVENLKTTKYRNGDIIGTTIPATLDISEESSPKYQWAYAGNESNVATYGRLYTWNVATDSRKICPSGWHLPSDAEWTTLTTYLGGERVAGGKLKESGTNHWTSPNTGATNSSGFTALPGGYRYGIGTFYDVGYDGGWWNSTENSASYSLIHYYSRDLNRNFDGKAFGFSVRCIKD